MLALFKACLVLIEFNLTIDPVNSNCSVRIPVLPCPIHQIDSRWEGLTSLLVAYVNLKLAKWIGDASGLLFIEIIQNRPKPWDENNQ